MLIPRVNSLAFPRIRTDMAEHEDSVAEEEFGSGDDGAHERTCCQ